MAQFVTPPLKAPPNTVQVYVDFYDSSEKQAFLGSAMAPVVTDLPKTLTIASADLCAYYLYYQRQKGVPGLSSHADIAAHWYRALHELDLRVEFHASSVRIAPNVTLDTGTTERLGEAIGLSVASGLHGLHQADWGRIPESNKRKTLDFRYPITASDGKHFIQVEAKGSAVADNEKKASTVAKHKASIKAKKGEVTDEERKSSLLYGTIGVLVLDQA